MGYNCSNFITKKQGGEVISEACISDNFGAIGAIYPGHAIGLPLKIVEYDPEGAMDTYSKAISIKAEPLDSTLFLPPTLPVNN